MLSESIKVFIATYWDVMMLPLWLSVAAAEGEPIILVLKTLFSIPSSEANDIAVPIWFIGFIAIALFMMHKHS
jgi:hypothetical protein